MIKSFFRADKNAKTFGFSAYAVCQTVAMVLIFLGAVFLTKIYELFPPFMQMFTNTPIYAVLVLSAISMLCLSAWAVYKFKIAKHILLYAVLVGAAGIATYFLSIRPSFSGKPYVSILAPALMQVGVIALILCVVRHKRLSLNKSSETFTNYQGIFVLALFAAVLVYAIDDIGSNYEAGFNEAVTQFGASHRGEYSVPEQAVISHQMKFYCRMENGAARCR